MNANAFFSLLLLLFIGLKLGGIIDWSWWWVMAPFWIPCCVAAIAGIAYLVARRFESKEAKAARLLRAYGEALTRKP
jgi:hypothetical protein